MLQGKGRTAVLCSHGALQQYKKVYRRRDPARLEWEESGSKKLCLAVQGTEAMARYRQAAKAQGKSTDTAQSPHSAITVDRDQFDLRLLSTTAGSFAGIAPAHCISAVQPACIRLCLLQAYRHTW